jgi:hypothetical protein
MNKFKNHFPAHSNTKFYSDGKKKIDPSLYTGTGGNLYLYYKLVQYAKF